MIRGVPSPIRPRHHGRGVGHRVETDREAEIEAGEVAHPFRGVAHVDGDVEGRLHPGEGGDDLAPEMLDRRHRQRALMRGDQPAHHRGFAAGPEGVARLAGSLDPDQRVDHGAALDEQAMHIVIDCVDLLAEGRPGLSVSRRFGHGSGGRRGGSDCGLVEGADS
ncbi:MAG: hypothetical protein RLO48_19635 [Bauldia litoralis]